MISTGLGLHDPHELRRGAMVLGGRFSIDSVVGRGGIATVYRVRGQSGEIAALKVMTSRYAGDADMESRFENEFRLGRQLDKLPFLARVRERGRLAELSGNLYMLQDYVRGPTLELRLAQGPLPIREACRIVRDLAHAVAKLHDRGVVHRDLNPSNIVLEKHPMSGDELPIIIDLGCAYVLGSSKIATNDFATDPEHRPGTRMYMAPEQALGEPPSPSFDLYALTVVIYECLIGRPPYAGHPDHEVVQRKCDPEQPSFSIAGKREGLPSELVELVDEGLRREPERRMPSAKELSRRLDSIVKELRESYTPAQAEAFIYAIDKQTAWDREQDEAEARAKVHAERKAEDLVEQAERNAEREREFQLPTLVVRDATVEMPKDRLPKPPPVVISPELAVLQEPVPIVRGSTVEADASPPTQVTPPAERGSTIEAEATTVEVRCPGPIGPSAATAVSAPSEIEQEPADSVGSTITLEAQAPTPSAAAAEGTKPTTTSEVDHGGPREVGKRDSVARTRPRNVAVAFAGVVAVVLVVSLTGGMWLLPRLRVGESVAEGPAASAVPVEPRHELAVSSAALRQSGLPEAPPSPAVRASLSTEQIVSVSPEQREPEQETPSMPVVVPKPNPDQELRPTSPTKSAPVRPPAWQGTHCQALRDQAEDAVRQKNYDTALDLLAERNCWRDKTDHRRLKITALSYARRFSECIETGQGSDDPEIRSFVEFCRAKASSP